MFKLVSNYKPTGDQPKAIEYLSNDIPNSKNSSLGNNVEYFVS